MDYLDKLVRIKNHKKRGDDLERLRKKVGHLPPVFEAFFKIFNINEGDDIHKGGFDSHRLVYLDKNEDLRSINIWNHPYQDGYGPSFFFDFEDYENQMLSSFPDDEEDIYVGNYIMIGVTDYSFPLVIGMKEKNMDVVFVYNMDDAKLDFVANNIFEYFMNMKLIWEEDNEFPYGKTINDLYMKWGENFWRFEGWPPEEG